MIEIELAGNGRGEFDQISVGQNASLAGTLKIILLDDYLPEHGAIFDVFTALALSGTFDFIDCSLCANREFAVNYEADGFSLEVSAVPVPTAVWLLSSALVALGRVSSRRGDSYRRAA